MSQDYTSNIWKYYVYYFITGFYLSASIIVMFYLANNVSYFQVGTIIAAGFFVLMLLEIPSGAFADLIGRKVAVFVGLLFSGMEFLLIGYSANYVSFVIAAVLGGIGLSLVSGADVSLLYDSLKQSKKEKLFKKIKGRANAVTYVSIAMAALIGSIIYVWNNSLVFYINGLMFIFGGFFFLTLKEPKFKRRKFNLKNQTAHIKESFSYLFDNKRLCWFMGFSIISGGFLSLFHNIIQQPYFAWLGFNIAIFGTLLAIIFIIRSLVSLVSYKVEKKIGEKASLYLIILLQFVFFFIMGYFVGIWLIVFVILIYAIWSYQEVVLENYLHEHMNSKQRATLYSINSFLRNLILSVAFILFGYIIDLTSISFSIYVLSIGSLVFGLGILLTRDVAGPHKQKS
jgi:MFS family permease